MAVVDTRSASLSGVTATVNGLTAAIVGSGVVMMIAAAVSSVVMMIVVISVLAMIVVGIAGAISVVMTDAVALRIAVVVGSSSATIGVRVFVTIAGAEALAATSVARTRTTRTTPRLRNTFPPTAMSRRFLPASVLTSWTATRCAR